MFSTNIKLAIRNLFRFRTYTTLNIAGLTVGLAMGIFGILYVRYELGYNNMHVNKSRMYKLIGFTKQADNKSYSILHNSALLGESLKQQVSQIEAYNRYNYTYLYFKKENEPIGESGIFADENFFQFYNFEVKEGNPSTMLKEPNSIVITERLAKKLFGDKPAMNQTVSTLLNNKPAVYQVTGIVKDVEHSSVDFEFVLPFNNFLSLNLWANSYSAVSCEIMYLMKTGVDIASVNNKIKNFLVDKDTENNKELFLQPLSEFDLYYYQDGQRRMAKMMIVIIMTVVAGLILIISCFNFINMAIAIGIKRYKEAGIKKVLGSSQSTILLQFLMESVIICLVALFFAFILLETFLPFYNRMDNVHLQVQCGNIGQLLAFVLFAMFVGVLAAFYPAYILSSTSPVTILRGATNKSQKIGFSRQGLIVFQFFITIILVVGLLVFSKQAGYINSKDIGLNRYNVMFFTAPNSILEQRNAFISDLNTLPEISSFSWSSQNPVGTYSSTNDVVWEGKQADQKMDFWMVATDSAFMKTVKIRLAEGRFFSENASDTGAYVINEEAVKSMHLADPVGKIITVNKKRGIIVGVVNNYNSLQLNTPYLPVILTNRPSEANMVFIRYSGYKDAFQKKLQTIYSKYESYIPFTPELMEDSFKRINSFASMASAVLSAFTVLAIFLSCMGLFGLASFTIETRTKEIGIRKSNGASTLSILRMFLKAYNKWILIASCIGLPLAFLIWNTLLSTIFAFHVSFPMWSLLFTPIIVILVSWSTVIWQSWKAANKNPVEALRYE